MCVLCVYIYVLRTLYDVKSDNSPDYGSAHIGYRTPTIHYSNNIFINF